MKSCLLKILPTKYSFRNPWLNVYTYRQNLALNNLQRLMHHKTQTIKQQNQTHRETKTRTYTCLFVCWLVGWVLWHINLCRLFNVKSKTWFNLMPWLPLWNTHQMVGGYLFFKGYNSRVNNYQWFFFSNECISIYARIDTHGLYTVYIHRNSCVYVCTWIIIYILYIFLIKMIMSVCILEIPCFSEACLDQS